MDLYITIVGLYSQNRHEVLKVVNTAIHSKCLRDFISMHIIFVQFLIERVSDLTIAYLFYIISTFTKDIRKQSPIT